MHSSGQETQDVVHDLVHHLWVYLLGQPGGVSQIAKEYGDLFALAFQGAAGGEDVFGEVFRGVGRQ